MRRVNIILSIVLLSVVCGCDHQRMAQLRDVEQLLKEQLNDSAYHVLRSIDIEGVDNVAFQAYYTLLRTQAEYRLLIPINTTDMLDRSIAYYEKISDTDKLIRCYYYKGSISDDLGNDTMAIACLNTAETLLSTSGTDDYYKLCVYEAKANVNEEAKQYRLAVDYLLKAVRCAVNQKDTIALAYDYMNLGAVYYEMGMEDSSSYFRQKMEPLLVHIPEQRRSSFYTNLGSYYENINTDTAKLYYQRAIALGSHYAYNHLAQLYSKEGQRELAFQNWEKAAETRDPKLKADVLSRMLSTYENLHKYEEVCRIQSLLIPLKDSISQKQIKEDILGIQERHKIELLQKENEERIYRLVVCLLVLLLSALAVIVFMKRHQVLQKSQLKEDQLLLSHYLSQLKSLKETGEQHEREIMLLNKKILELENKRGAILAKGKSLYDNIMDGATTLFWKQTDFAAFLAYYKVLDFEFMKSLEDDYDNLPRRYMFLEVLYHLQFSTDQIVCAMAVEERTIRSYKSRIKSCRKQG